MGGGKGKKDVNAKLTTNFINIVHMCDMVMKKGNVLGQKPNFYFNVLVRLTVYPLTSNSMVNISPYV
jgi:hypothetical protein